MPAHVRFASYLLCVAMLGADLARGDILDHDALAQQHFSANADWFRRNIPFLETSDLNIQQVYYYRWDLVNKHLIWLPQKQHWVISEFYHPVWWEHPDRTIVAPAAHQIREARWLRNSTYTDSYLDYWAKGNGYAYQYSNWLADATWQNFLATGNPEAAAAHLQFLKTNYQNWMNLRFDPARGMFWQRPGQDATEFSVGDLQTGGTGGGDAYRPTINAYMYANAAAISRIAQLAGDTATAADFAARAASLKARLESELWNPALGHFMDRFTSVYPQLEYQFIASRELAGMIPWNFSMPADDATFAAAWKRVFDSQTGFLAAHGLRTVEPDSPYYMNPVASPSSPELNTWNGPSWPFYTGMVLNGLANVLNDYSNHSLTREQYVQLLRHYTLEQYKNGVPYVAEETDPDTGQWIVDVPNRSEHYFHSTYNDLIITGLAGLRPRADHIVEINPLIDPSIEYLALEAIPYHGHEISIIWDTQDRYGLGVGLHLLINGREFASSDTLERLTSPLPLMADANFDGIVDASDLAQLAQHWQLEGAWADGDFDHSGFVDIDDLLLLARNWNAGGGLTSLEAMLPALGLPAVPEPSGATLLVLLPAVAARRRR